MDPYNRLISRILLDADLKSVLDVQVTEEFFPDEDHRRAFVWILDYWRRFSKVPGSAIFSAEFPEYRLVEPQEPMEAYLAEVRKRRRFTLIYGAVAESILALEQEDTDIAVGILRSGLLQADVEVAELRDVDITKTWVTRLETYADWKNNSGKIRGIPTGFPTFDAVLGGYQAGQLITYLGEPKSGKSTLLLRTAIEAHAQGHTPLFIGFEMTNDEQTARHDSMISGVNYARIISGRTSVEEDQRLHDALQGMADMHPFVLSSDPSGTTVSGIAAKIETYSPDIVFIDGVYLMKDEDGGRDDREKLTNLTRSLKRLATRIDRPVVIATQALSWKVNKAKGLEASSIGYSSSFAQDSDAIIGIESLEDPSEPRRKLKIVSARNAPYREILASWDWETGKFSELVEEPAPMWTLNGENKAVAQSALERRGKKIVRRTDGSG